MRRCNNLLLAGVVVAAISALIIAYLSLSPDGSPPLRCPFKALTGLDCPGCGSQRAFQALLKGDFAAAWGYNPAALLAFPLAVFFIIVEAGRKKWPGLHRAVMSRAAIAAVGAAVVAWWIARNL